MKPAVLVLFMLLTVVGRNTPAVTNGQDRTTKIVLPSNYTADKRWPLVLLLHGYTGNGALIDSYFGFSSEVTRRGFILITVEGLKDSMGYRYWNATDGCCDFDHRGNDDVTYLKNILAEAQSKYSIDARRIYVAGHSNGGFMAHRLACDLSDTISAIVSFAGETWQDPEACKPVSAVSVLQIQAIDDDTINYDGDLKGYPKLSGYPGAIETVTRWRAYDHCARLTKSSRIDLTLSIPGADTSVTKWAVCSDGTQVELWTIDAHKSWWHFPHDPFLHQDFTEKVLDFLLQKSRE